MKNPIAERKARRWTQTTTAYHAGLSQSQISAFERGRAVPTPEQARRWAKALGLSVDALDREVRNPNDKDKDHAGSDPRPTP